MILIQRLAMWVGVAGLVPFVIGALLVGLWGSHREFMLDLFYLYCAGILAFMAGVYWPISLQLGARSYPLSPVTALFLSQGFFVVAGVALLLPTAWTSLVFPLAYVLLFWVDYRAIGPFWPDWYLRLRGGLTAVAVLCQTTVALVYWIGE